MTKRCLGDGLCLVTYETMPPHIETDGGDVLAEVLTSGDVDVTGPTPTWAMLELLRAFETYETRRKRVALTRK